MARYRFNELRMKLEWAQLDFRRETVLGLGRDLVFEAQDQQTRQWIEIGRVHDGWAPDEVLSEASGGSNEYSVTVIWREGLDDLVKSANAVRVGETRIEKRASDPALQSPYVVRLRGQIISGFRSVLQEVRA